MNGEGSTSWDWEGRGLAWTWYFARNEGDVINWNVSEIQIRQKILVR